MILAHQGRPSKAAVPSLTFGILLKCYRLAAGLTQKELAAQAGLSLHGIGDPEGGKRRAPRKELVQLLAEALNPSPVEWATLKAAALQRVVPPPVLATFLISASIGTGNLCFCPDT